MGTGVFSLSFYIHYYCLWRFEMTGKLRLLFLGIVLSLTSGCANTPVFSVEVYASPTAYQEYPVLATASPYVQQFATASPSPLPPLSTVSAFTQAPAAMPADFSPILYGEKYDGNTFFFLLGGVQAGQWLTPEQAASLMRGTSEYDVHTSSLEMFQVLGYAPETTPTRPGQYIIHSDSTKDGFGMLGVAQGWPVQQGKVEELSSKNEQYIQVVRDWLKGAGISDPQLGTLHIFRVDLEGDGVNEVFLSVTRLDDSQHTTRAGDYSIILMRKVVGNEAMTVPLIADIYRTKDAEISYPRTYRLANFMDLDQDGILEAVVDYHRWEEDGAMIYTIQGQEITQVP
jgi:hypothetical protein